MWGDMGRAMIVVVLVVVVVVLSTLTRKVWLCLARIESRPFLLSGEPASLMARQRAGLAYRVVAVLRNSDDPDKNDPSPSIYHEMRKSI